MRFACTFTAALFVVPVVTGCASTGSAINSSPASPASTGVLGPQQLELGECGLFAWDVSGGAEFVFFATPKDGLALIDSEVVRLPSVGEIPAPDGVYGPVSLQLGRADTLDQGTRYPGALMKYKQVDGFVRTVPVVAIESCVGVDAPL